MKRSMVIFCAEIQNKLTALFKMGLTLKFINSYSDYKVTLMITIANTHTPDHV